MRRSWVALLGLVVLACGAPPRARHVVLVVIDTLRADHVGSYGHARATSPALDGLAARGVRFERAYATAPWTKPSVASIFTGLQPGEHGAEGIWRVLAPELETLAERLRARGFATGGIVSHEMLGALTGFDQGFDSWDERFARGPNFVSTRGVTLHAVGKLREFAAGDAPFFLFVHYFDPHYNYRPHPEVDFAPERVGRLDGSQRISRLRELLPTLRPEELAFLRDLYDEEIRFTDDGLAALLEALGSLGLAGETLVVVTADHGEAFGERGWLGHTVSLHEELVRVPLVVADPAGGARGRVVSEPVSLASLPATILDLLGQEHALPGPSLADAVRGAAGAPQDPVHLEVAYRPFLRDRLEKRAVQQAVVYRGHKLIRDDAGRLSLYDLRTDPGERVDLSAQRPERVRELEALLDRQARRRRVEAPSREPSTEEIERMRELGYIDS